MKSKQLTFAREYRGFTQKALSDAISGLSQSNLSKYEKGIGTLSDETVNRIMSFLKFPTSFLDLNIGDNVEYKHYRKKNSKISATDKKKIDRMISLIAYTFDWMSDMVELPDFTLGSYDLEQGISPKDVAKQIRRQCKIGVVPILKICTILEKNGIFLYFWDCPYDDFDGVSLITDKGYHLIVVNKNHSNDRLRWTISHETGHNLMHECTTFFLNENRDKEKEANEFAGEFLMPESEVKRAFVGLTMKRAYEYKSYWLTSIAAIIQRAKILGSITNDKYVQLRVELSRRHWNEKEPIIVYLDKPTVFDEMYNLIINNLHYNVGNLVESMCIPADIIDEIFAKPKTIKLKIS